MKEIDKMLLFVGGFWLACFIPLFLSVTNDLSTKIVGVVVIATVTVGAVIIGKVDQWARRQDGGPPKAGG